MNGLPPLNERGMATPQNPLIPAKAGTQAFSELRLTAQASVHPTERVSGCFKKTWVLAFARMSGVWGPFRVPCGSLHQRLDVPRMDVIARGLAR